MLKYGIAIFLVFSLFGRVDIFYSDEYSPQLMEAIESSYREDFLGADSLLDELLAETHDTIAIYFFKATVSYSRMKDTEDFRDKDLLESQMTFIEERIEDSHEYRDSFIMGMISFYRALLLVDTDGSLLSAFNNLREASRRLSIAAKDSVLKADAYLGLGTYKFFRSSMAGVLRSIGIISDEREEGIAMLHDAAGSSRFGKWPAMHALAIAYTELGEFGKADSIVSIMRELNPHGRTPLWDAIHLAKARKDHHKVIIIAEELLTLFDEGNGYNQIEVLHIIFHAQNQLGKSKDAKRTAEKALHINANDDVLHRQRRKLREMKNFIEN